MTASNPKDSKGSSTLALVEASLCLLHEIAHALF
jgi:hypothetical protein